MKRMTHETLRMVFLAAALLSALVAPAPILAQSAPPPTAPAASAPPATAPATPPAQNSTAPDKSSNLPVAAVIHSESRLVLVDTVVTDKRGKYVRDLTQKDFKVFEDNKEQPVVNFSAGTDATLQANAPRRYLILFFDNSTMDTPDQI